MPKVEIITARAHRLLGPVIDRIGALYRQSESCILLVPEQFTLQAERELMARLRLTAMFSLTVLSPSRLSERVLDAAGSDERMPLDSAGRRMAVGRALERCEDQLLYYRSAAHRRGFIEKMTALIGDMKRGGLTPEGLREYAETLEEGAEKHQDLAKIYEAYRQVLGQRFSDDEDRLNYVSARLARSGIFKGEHLFVYGFDTLPETMTRLLCAAAPLCESLNIALVCDGESATDGDLYLPVRQGIGRFSALLEAEGIDVRVCPVPQLPLESNTTIRHLDKALFSHPPKRMEGKAEGVFLWAGQSPFEEATLAVREIMWLLENGMDPERVAVLYPEDNGYPFAVTAALSDSGLPFYTDQKLPATSHGLVRCILSALRAMANDYRNEDLMGVLKSGYASLSFEEACTLEHFAKSTGINRARWTKSFTKGEEQRREQCELLRRRLMEPLMRARATLVAARDTQASLEAVVGFLGDIGAYQTLCDEEEKLLEKGLLARANQNSQIWQTLLNVLEQLHALSGGARVPLKYIATRLECGLASVSLASLPPAGQMLHAGTLGHSLSAGADAVFLLGLNDGVLTRSAESLLSEEERARTEQETGAYLGLTDDSRNTFARLDLKQAMTLPTQYLFVSHAKTATDGTALRPLSLLKTLVEHLLGGLEQSPIPQPDLPMSSTQALAELSVLLRAYADGTGGEDPLPPRRREMLAKLLSSKQTAEKTMRLLRAANHRVEAQPLRAKEAMALYGGENLSVSRLEQFADCPFRHFVTYGLRPQILKEWKVEPIDKGNFYHDSLNRFALLSRSYASYPHISEEEVRALADAAIEPLTEELLQGPMGDGARSQAQYERARSTIYRAALTVTRHLAAGDFTVDRTEASFGYPGGMPPIVLALTDGREVMLRGRIDRVDRADANGSVYLRVIDYKSGRRDLEAAKTWWGLQLQLLLYLDACVNACPGALPAGAFYFYVADPLVESETDLRSAAEDKLREILQLRGIVLSDVEVLTAMDDQESPVALPKMLNKDGSVRPTAKALDLSQMEALLGHAREVAARLAEGMYAGRTDIRPTKDGSASSCDYCDYAGLCGFDPDAEDAQWQELPAMSMEELREKLSPFRDEMKP